jgi:hypothetical protein
MYVCQSMGGRTTKKQDQKSLDELERKERLLSRKSAAIERDTTSRWARIRACLRPFEVCDRVRERESTTGCACLSLCVTAPTHGDA